MNKPQSPISDKYMALLTEFALDANLRNRGSVNKKDIHFARHFLSFLEERKQYRINKVSHQDILEYVAFVKSKISRVRKSPLAPSTVSGYVRSLSKFNEFLLKTGKTRESWGGLRISGIEKEERFSLTVEEVQELFAASESLRDTAILTLAYGCGLRRTEIHRLDVQDVNIREGVLVVREGKFHKRRDVVLTDGVITHLRNYLITERALYLKTVRNLESAFLVNNRGRRMSGEHINSCVKKLGVKTGNTLLASQNIGLHSLRHSISEHLLKRGADIEFVQEFLGHSCIDTTMIYARKQQRKLKNRQIFLK